jgi:DNA-directed RNA polymerase specialized sigma24 family protein
MSDSDHSVPTLEPSDEELWTAFVGGDDDAVETLVERHGKGLYWYLVLSTGDQQAAAQHLLRTWELAAGYRRPFAGFRSFRAWIYAVATQNAVPATQPDVIGLADLLDDVRRSPELPGRGELFFAIRDLLRWTRQPFLLVSVVGLGIDEAARACGFTEERAVRAIDQALRQLSRLASVAGRKAEGEL